MRKIVFANQKGGVAKSTTCVNVAAGLAHDHQVLLIDIDPQANATFTTIGHAEPDPTIYDILIGKSTVTQAITKAKYTNIDVVP